MSPLQRFASEEGSVSSVDSLTDEILDVLERRFPETPVYEHPLGFVHFELPESRVASGLGRLRLHLWDDACHQPDQLGRLHDHAWNLRSLVVAGALEDSLFDVEYRFDGDLREVVVRYEPTIERVPTDRKADLRVRSTRRVDAGSEYTVEVGVVHETTVLRTPTVTLVAASPVVGSTTRIFAPRDATWRSTSIRRSLDRGVALVRLQTALSRNT